MERTRTETPEGTEALAGRLAERLRPGDVVLVTGELGVGKTTFVRGACRALGVREPVTSPTFTIGQRYSGDVPISHLDLFRLGSLADEEPGLLDEYLTDDAIAFVEWPEAGEGELDRVALRVEVSYAGGDAREVAIS